MTLKHAIPALAALVALAAGGCGGAEDEGDPGSGNPESELTADEATAPLEEGPAPLRELRDQANELLGGTAADFERALEDVRGFPVVVNKWASWCGPCRFEFPYFQAQATERGDEVAFLGVDSNDSEEAAKTFLEELPLPYPSYLDPDQEIADEFMNNSREFPATAFYDARGKLTFVHLGVYPDEDALAADINRYARSG
jgi:thiol-disulfide isomerase/thioredoxin